MNKLVVQVLWLLLAAAVAAVIIPAAVQKLIGAPAALRPFEEFGWPMWTVYLTAFGELAGSIALFVPRARSLGGLVLAAVMVGAAATNFANGDAQYVPQNLLLLAGSLLLAWQGRKHLPLARGRRPSG